MNSANAIDVKSVFVILAFLARLTLANWHEWWTYDGISGPSYWGVINPAWTMCNKGRQQSPVDITPAQLVYDSRYVNPSNNKFSYIDGSCAVVV